MKLLQINDNEFVNQDLITVISGDENNCCWVRMLGEDFGRFCDRYSAIQLMSIICEEVDYGAEVDKTRHEIRVLQSEIDYKKDIINHIMWRMTHGNDGIRKDD